MLLLSMGDRGKLVAIEMIWITHLAQLHHFHVFNRFWSFSMEDVHRFNKVSDGRVVWGLKSLLSARGDRRHRSVFISQAVKG